MLAAKIGLSFADKIRAKAEEEAKAIKVPIEVKKGKKIVVKVLKAEKPKKIKLKAKKR